MAKRKRKQWWMRRYWQVCGVAGLAIIAIIGGSMVANRNAITMGFKANGVTISWLPHGVSRFDSEISEQARRYNIDANIIAILMTLESGGYTKANSGVAHGLMQVTPGTAIDIATKYLFEPIKTYDLFNPKTSIEFGAAYIAHLRTTFCGEADGMESSKCIELIAAGYNGGPGAANLVYTGKGLVEDQTIIYSRNAVKMWQEKSQKDSSTYRSWLKAGGQELVDLAMNEKQQQ